MPNTSGSGDAVFTEMLQFTVDTDQFAADLRQIESEWDASLGRMADATQAKGFKATDLFDAKAVEGQIEGLKSTVQDLATTIGNAFETLTTNINDQLDEVQAKAEKTAETVAASTSGAGGAGGGGIVGGLHPRTRSFGYGEGGGGFFGDIVSGFKGSDSISMGQMIGAMARFQLMWTGLRVIIDGVRGAIMAIPDAIGAIMSGGFDFLTKMQATSATLRAALLDTAQFSKDSTENLKLAGAAADQLTLKINDLAIKMSMKPEAIQNGFLSFLNAGGGNLVGTGPNALNDALTTSALLTQIMTLTGGSANPRQMSSQMTGFLSGHPSSNNRLMTGMGMNPAQVEQMMQQAGQYNNLLQQVQEKVIGIISKMDDWNQRHEALIGFMDLYKKSWEGLVAGPVFSALDEGLARVAKWLVDNKELVDGFGRAMGQMVLDLFNSVESLVSSNWSPILQLFQQLAIYTANAATNITTMVNDLNAFLQIRARIQENPVTRNMENGTRQWLNLLPGNNIPMEQAPTTNASVDISKIMADLTEKNAKAIADREALGKAIFGESTGDNSGTGAGTSSVEKWLRALANPNAAKDGLKQLDESFKSTFETIRNEYDKTRSGYESLIKAHKDSAQEMTPALLKTWDDEDKAIKTAINSLKAHAAQLGLTAEQLRDFDAKVDAAYKTFQGQENKGRTRITDAASTENIAQTKLNLKTREEMIALDAQAEISVTKKLAQEKVITETTALDRIQAAEKTIHDAKMARWSDERSQYGVNTTAYKTLTADMAEEDAKFSTETVSNSHARAKAVEDEIVAREKLALSQSKLVVGAAQGIANSARSGGASAQTQYADELALADAERKAAQIAAKNAFDDYTRASKDRELTEQAVAQYRLAWDKAVQAVTDATGKFEQQSLKGSLQDQLFGGPESLAVHFSSVAAASKSLESAFKVLNTAVDTIRKGFQQGGLFGGLGAIGQVGSQALGGIGTSLSGLGMTGAGDMLSQVAGPIAGVAGSLFSVLGGIFQNAAKNIAVDVQNAYKKILKDYQDGNASFSTTMSDLEKEKQDAISRLGGKKKGKQYLQSILDQINQSEDQLQQQATKTKEAFEQQLVIMSQGNSVAQDWVKSFSEANTAVKNYLNSLSDSQKAQFGYKYAGQYQNLIYQQQMTGLQDNFNKGEQQAIQDGLQMNSLLTQRASIQDEINKLQMKQDDSIERREAGAISANKTYQDQLKALKDQLTQNQSDIDLATRKFNMEKDIFGLTSDVNQLHQKDSDLQIASLQQQIDQWNTMKYIIDQIHQEMANGWNPQNTVNGYFGGNSPFLDNMGIPGFGAAGGASAAPQYNIVVNVPYDGSSSGYAYGQQVGTGVAEELAYANRGRYGVY